MRMKEADRPVLIDTSVWIDYFRKKAGVYHKVNELMDSGRACCLGLIIAELIQGAASEREIAVIKDLAHILPLLPEAPNTWEEAGILSFRLRKAGRKVGLIDCYIAIMGKKNKVAIWTFDKDFIQIKELLDIVLLKS